MAFEPLTMFFGRHDRLLRFSPGETMPKIALVLDTTQVFGGGKTSMLIIYWKADKCTESSPAMHPSCAATQSRSVPGADSWLWVRTKTIG